MKTQGARDDQELVTIESFNRPTDAHMARAALEAEGIEAVVVNDGVVNLTFYTALPENLVRLQVRMADAERACRILGHTRTKAAHEHSAKPPAPPQCPRCGDQTMQPIPHTLLGGLLNALRSFYDPALACRRWHCPSCGDQVTHRV